ncbi:HK97-gp10 family putative phage morphogenesis protein [Mesorhizobium marinum]|uniref:HK97-gp10 family putative phage morphogenesis protein n=1 Tax=Mesorhizobium marinum TaxID=3228790 RepID=UPI00346630EE
MAKSAQIARLQRRIEAIPQAVREQVRPALMQSGEELAATMRRLAPVDEGDLRDSITVTGPGQSTPAYSQPGGSQIAGELEVLVTAGNSDVRYPHLVEYGTAHAAAQPFFWPAFRLGRKKLAGRIKRAVSKAVRDHWAGR